MNQTSFARILKRTTRLAFILTLTLPFSASLAQVPGLLSYQGRIIVGSGNFDGSGQFKFALVNSNGTASYWSNDGSSAGGNQPGTAVALTVTKGLYSLLLGDTNLAHMTASVPFTAFTNSDVRLRVWFNDGTNGFQLLEPDQRLGGVGYALVAAAVPSGSISSNSIAAGSIGTSQLATGAVTAAKIATNQVVKSLNGLTDAVTLSPGANVSLSTNANNLTISAGSAAWSLAGNAGTSPGLNFVGTTDNQPLELRVNGQRALRIEPNTNGAPNIIGGSPVNFIAPGIDGATIGGGGSLADTWTNQVTASYGTVSGGANNAADYEATVGGGIGNAASGAASTIAGGYVSIAPGEFATVGGGFHNIASGGSATVGGGSQNIASGVYATVAGGIGNLAGSNYCTVGGGWVNRATTNYATVGGGFVNQAVGYAATVGGGMVNIASNSYTTVTGGYQNIAGGLGDAVGGGYENVTSNSAYATVSGGNRNLATNSYSTVGGGQQNSAIGNGSTVGGGSGNIASDSDTTVAGGSGNAASNFWSTVGGGLLNIAGGGSSTIAGGEENTNNSDSATIGGGSQNDIDSGAFGSVIGGGDSNNIQTNASGSTIGGGGNNTIQTNAYTSTISGGSGNTIWTNSTFATIAGGIGNNILSNSTYSAIVGGFLNTAAGPGSTVAGGYQNIAFGSGSFAAGYEAQATNSGAFVWSDSSLNPPFGSTTTNQFNVRAFGGVRFVTGGAGMTVDGLPVTTTNALSNVAFLKGNQTFTGQNTFSGTVVANTIAPASTLTVAGDISLSGGAAYHNISMGGGNSIGYLYGAFNYGNQDGIQLGYNFYADSAGNGHVIHGDGGTSRIIAGYGEIKMEVGNPGFAPNSLMLLVNNSGVCVANGTVSSCSDRNVKQDVAPVSPAQILDRVLTLPVSEWSYKCDTATRHIGPMAQDFYSAFNVGQDEKHITSIDEGGVALAAIQGLNEKVEEKDAKIRDQESKIQNQSAELADLKQRLLALENIIRNQTSK
jgi:hypothetical protein